MPASQFFSILNSRDYQPLAHRRRSREGAGGGGHRPPNDGVGGTMHSAPPLNSDTSGP